MDRINIVPCKDGHPAAIGSITINVTIIVSFNTMDVECMGGTWTCFLQRQNGWAFVVNQYL